MQESPIKFTTIKRTSKDLYKGTTKVLKRGKVGIVTLTIDPEGTTVTIDGKSYGDSPLKQPIVLMPGTVTATNFSDSKMISPPSRSR